MSGIRVGYTGFFEIDLVDDYTWRTDGRGQAIALIHKAADAGIWLQKNCGFKKFHHHMQFNEHIHGLFTSFW